MALSLKSQGTRRKTVRAGPRNDCLWRPGFTFCDASDSKGFHATDLDGYERRLRATSLRAVVLCYDSGLWLLPRSPSRLRPRPRPGRANPGDPDRHELCPRLPGECDRYELRGRAGKRRACVVRAVIRQEAP